MHGRKDAEIMEFIDGVLIGFFIGVMVGRIISLIAEAHDRERAKKDE